VSGLTCAEVVAALTGYLEGEDGGAQGGALRGHLRLCAGCRQVAAEEAALRDGLRAMPPLDPPPQLWSRIQAGLAAAEVADAQRPAWRRAAARWGRHAPSPTTAAVGLALAAAAAAALWWRAERRAAPPPSIAVAEVAAPRPTPLPAHGQPEGTPDPARAAAPPGAEPDVAVALAGDADGRVASYQAAVTELDAQLAAASPRWSAARRGRFAAERDRRFAAIRAAGAGRAHDRAWRDAVRFLQDAVVADDEVAALEPAAPRGPR
jgi:hypothetical protein